MRTQTNVRKSKPKKSKPKGAETFNVGLVKTLNFIGQAHLLPGMNLDRLQETFRQHGITDLEALALAGEPVIDEVCREIAGVVEGAR